MGEVLKTHKDDAAVFEALYSRMMEKGGAAIRAKREGNGFRFIPSKSVPFGRTEFQMGVKSRSEVSSELKKPHDVVVIIYDDGRKSMGIPTAEVFDPADGSFMPFPYVISVSPNKNAPAAVEPLPRAIIRSDTENLKDKVRRLDDAFKRATEAEREALRRCQQGNVEVQKYEGCKRDLETHCRTGEKVRARAYADGRPFDSSTYELRKAQLTEAVNASREAATAALGAKPLLQSRNEKAQRKTEEAQTAYLKAAAKWAQARRDETKKELQAALDGLSVPLAQMRALDVIMAEGHLGHLAEADRYFRGLKAPFYGLNPLDVRPSWIVCGSAAELPGIAEARSALLDELHNAEAGV